VTVQTMTMELRPYQLEARNAIHEEWRKGNKRTLLVLPTGCGKTIVFSKVIEDCVKEGERVLVLAHRTELLDQAADKLEKSTGLKCAVEKAEQTSIGSFYRVVVGSVQTMMRDSRLKQFSPSHFQTVIVDEAHHAVSDSYQKVLNHFSLANVLGVTATPDRGDMRNIGSFFDTLAYEYKLPMAIKQGYLSPIKALTIPLKLDLTNVRIQSGDFAASDLDTALDPYLERIAHEMWEVAKHRKIVVFLPLIATSQRFADLLNRIGFKAAEVNGESYDRKEIIRDFEQGRYNVLCNSMLLTEGWDCPSVDCIVVLRPTESRSLYSQMIGRGTRLYEGKQELLVLDFLWHTERHALSHPAHLIAESDEIAEAMTKRIEEAGEAVDLEDAQKDAVESALKEREQSLAKQLEQNKNRSKKLVDHVQYEISIQAEDLINYQPAFSWEFEPTTEQQIQFIESAGINAEGILTKGKASKLINHVVSRRQEGLATPKQISLLEKRGFQHVGTWNFGKADRLITKMALNNWRIPYGIDPKTY
jgi:superfamily II DNA or RNA helicase